MHFNRLDKVPGRYRICSTSVAVTLIGSTLCLWQSSATAEWTGNIRLLSEYIHRGYSKSRGNPVVQAQFGYQDLDGLFAGTQVSQVRFDDRPNTDRAEFEARLYLGKNFSLSEDLRAELSASGYLFDGKIFDHSADYAEVYAALHYQDWLSLRVAIAPDAYQRNANVRSYEINYRRDLLDNLQFSSGLGFSQASQLLEQNYFYWNAGFSWFVTSNLSIDMRYVDVALSDYVLNPVTDKANTEFYPRPQDNKYQFSLTLGF
jgi:uncharacterized protein (TIGR02001 family)